MIAALLLALAIGQGRSPSPRAAELERVVLLRPTEVRGYLALAIEYERLNERARAEATLREAVASATDKKLARAGLIEFLARGDRWRDAVAEALPLAIDSSGRALVAQLRVNAGIDAYRSGNRTLAMSDWRDALADDPAMVEAAVNLTTALLEAGKRDSARIVATRALKWHPTEGRLLALRARTLSGEKGLVAAIEALRQLRAERPDDEAIGLELAHLLAASGGQNRLAGMVLYDSLVSRPEASERAFTIVTEFWLDAAQAKTAVAVAQSGTLKFPRSAALWAQLAEAHAMAKPAELGDAANAYRRAITLSSGPEQLQLALIDVHVSQGDTSSVLYVARDMIARPAPHDALITAATRVASLGTAGEVLADSIYGVMLSRDSADVAALEARGSLAETTRDTAKALSLFVRVVALDSSGPEAPLAILRLTRPAPRADSAQRLLRQAIWRGLATLQGLELSSTAAASASSTPRRLARLGPQVIRRDQVLAALRQTLDTVVFHTSWGKRELDQLRLAYPRSALIARYAADVAATGQSDADALASYERLVRRNPTDPDLQVRRASALERLGRTDDAIDAYTRALDLEPENDSTFRNVQRLRAQRGSLGALVDQLRRLRVRLPDSRLLADHEIEVLSRMGRYAEAQEAAKKLKELGAKP